MEHITKRDQRKTLAEQVAERLTAMIVAGRLVKGERLPSEFQLAEKLGVGRGTIREAVKILASKHIIRIRRGHGTYIAERPGMTDDPLGLAFIANKKKLALDLLELRMIIEPRIAALAARRASAADRENIETACSKVEMLLAEGEPYAHEDIALHEAIAKATGNQVIPMIIPIINSGVELFIELGDRDVMESTKTSHRAIVEAIHHQIPDEAHEAMRHHLESNKRSINNYIGDIQASETTNR